MFWYFVAKYYHKPIINFSRFSDLKLEPLIESKDVFTMFCSIL